MPESNRVRVDITYASILRVLVVIGITYLVFRLSDVLVLLFVAGILVAAFSPVIKKWSTKIGKTFSILILVLLIIGVIAGFISLIIPPLVAQTRQLIESLPDLVNRSSIIRSHLPSLEKSISTLSQSIGGLTTSFILFTTSVVGAVATFFMVLILSIYFLVDERIFTHFLATMIPVEKKEDVSDMINKISLKIGEWLRGQLLLGLVIGISVYIGLSIIGVKYALTLAVISGILEIFPIIGPIISGAFAALIALTISPLTALIVVVFYILLQQVENNLIVPKIMSKAIGLPPAIIIIAIIIGGKLLGILGALLAVPMSGILYVIFQDWDTIRKIFKKG